MELNVDKFRREVRMLNIKQTAQKAGVSPSALYDRIRKPENIKIKDFLVLCEEMQRDPAEYFVD